MELEAQKGGLTAQARSFLPILQKKKVVMAAMSWVIYVLLRHWPLSPHPLPWDKEIKFHPPSHAPSLSPLCPFPYKPVTPTLIQDWALLPSPTSSL